MLAQPKLLSFLRVVEQPEARISAKKSEPRADERGHLLRQRIVAGVTDEGGESVVSSPRERERLFHVGAKRTDGCPHAFVLHPAGGFLFRFRAKRGAFQ